MRTSVLEVVVMERVLSLLLWNQVGDVRHADVRVKVDKKKNGERQKKKQKNSTYKM